MTTELKPRTSEVNGKLWGSRAQDWADIQEATVRAVYEEVLEQLAVGGRTKFLDAGCGSGLAASLAEALGAEVFGIDASDPLLEIAEELSPESNFRKGDLEELPYKDNQFDLVTGFNSFQYAGNPSAALAEAKRVTKPSGRVVIMTWGEPEGMEAAQVITALKPLLPPPPKDAPGPFALSDEAKLREFASSAGLEPLEVFDVESPWFYSDSETAVRGLMSAGTAAKPIEVLGEDVVAKAFAKALEPFEQEGGSISIDATFRCLIAKP